MMTRTAYFLTVVLLLFGFTTSTVYADSAALIHYIKSGHPFKVVFDKTTGKFNDSKYTGDWKTDPMGTLKGGETYTVVYKGGKFECTGFNQGTGNVGTWTYANADPSDSLISLWGRVYVFAGNGDVYDPTYGVVGHLAALQKQPLTTIQGKVTDIKGNVITITDEKGRKRILEIKSVGGIKIGTIAICEEDCGHQIKIGEKIINVLRIIQ